MGVVYHFAFLFKWVSLVMALPSVRKNRLLSAKSLSVSFSEKCWETSGALKRRDWVPSFRRFEVSVCLSPQ